MNTLIQLIPSLVLALGVALFLKALHLYQSGKLSTGANLRARLAVLITSLVTMPSFAQAAVTDLKTATESGNAIIMYLSGVFAAIGIVTAGVAMMMGRQAVAKWAFVGAMVCGLAFAIVRTMWSSMGLEAADVGSF